MKHYLAGIAAVGLIISNAWAAPFNTNLVVNGDAETGDLSGWVLSDTDGAQVTTSVVFSGVYSFTAGPGPNPTTMQQEIDLSGIASLIDNGAVDYSLSAQLQNRSFDFVSMQLSFFDGAQNQVGGTTSISDPSSSPFVWDFLGQTTGTLASGVRTALVAFVFSRSAGVSSDAYVDEVNFSLSTLDAPKVPAPAALPLFLAGIAGLVRKARKSVSAHR